MTVRGFDARLQQSAEMNICAAFAS